MVAVPRPDTLPVAYEDPRSPFINNDDPETAPRRLLEDLYVLGNAEGPAPVRPDRDIEVDRSGIIPMLASQAGKRFPQGKSAFGSPDAMRQAGLTGVVWRLSAGTLVPGGVVIVADGVDVIPDSPNPPGHRTLCPVERMGLVDFGERYLRLPWENTGLRIRR